MWELDFALMKYNPAPLVTVVKMTVYSQGNSTDLTSQS